MSRLAEYDELSVLDAVAVAPAEARPTFVLEVVVFVTDCDSTLLVDVVFDASPAYFAVSECVPAASAAVAHVAVRELPLPISATAPQPETVLAPSLNATVPVGEAPLTVAVNVTLVPQLTGLAELDSDVDDVVVVEPPGPVTCTVSALAVAPRTVIVMP